ncbi:short chain dehydrogenase [Streptomyces sp. Ncost-T6T-2b]|nr:short chain dehydrogenase [Streptomyces sp. Ncost-T6T-2b]
MSENPTDRGRFSGRVAVVTGAGRGIGLAVAERLVAEGARACITARRAGPLEAAAATLPPGSVVTVAAGRTTPSTVVNLSSVPHDTSFGPSLETGVPRLLEQAGHYAGLTATTRR